MIHPVTLTPELLAYVRRHTLTPDPLLAEMREATERLAEGAMQIHPEVGELLSMLVKLTEARRTLEIGVFTGYSTLCVARALPPNGHIVAFDDNQEYTDVARGYWQRAGVADMIELRLGDAKAELAQLVAAGAAGSFDFALLDADQPHYPAYWEPLLTLLRPGALLVIDNALYLGQVVNPDTVDPYALGVRALNELIVEDKRVESVLLPLADGVTLARVR